MNATESPIWIKHAGDIFFLICFLVIFFFVKPLPEDQDSTDDEIEGPNPLEKMLVNDSEDQEEDPETGNPDKE